MKFQDQHEIVSRISPTRSRRCAPRAGTTRCSSSRTRVSVHPRRAGALPGVLAVGSARRARTATASSRRRRRSLRHRQIHLSHPRVHGGGRTSQPRHRQAVVRPSHLHETSVARQAADGKLREAIGGARSSISSVGDARDARRRRLRRAGRRPTAAGRRPAEVRTRGGRLPIGGFTRGVHRRDVSRRGEGGKRRRSRAGRVGGGGADGGVGRHRRLRLREKKTRAVE